MATKDPKTWYDRGRHEAANIQYHSNRRELKDLLQNGFKHMTLQYPKLDAWELWAMIEDLNDERLGADPDHKVYPELKGLRECYRERQRGFMDAAQCTRAEMAFFYNWSWFETRRLHTRYASRPSAGSGEGCTVLFFKDSDAGLWTVASFSCVMQGKGRRMLYWRVEDGKPAYANLPYLVPGDGAATEPGWEKGTRPLPGDEGFSDAVINIQRH